MHPRLILAVTRKDALDFLLDKSKIAALIVPFFLAGIWVLISHLTGRPASLLVYNAGNSPLPQVVSSTLSSALITEATSPDEVSAAFGISGTQKSAKYNIGLVIPNGFEQQLRAGSHPQLTLYVDGSAVGAQQRSALQAVIANYARNVAAPNPPLGLDTEVINPGPTAASTLTVGKLYSLLILPISFVIGLSFMSGLFIEEKEKQTLRWLLVTPATLGDIVLGKVLVVIIYQLALSLLLLAVMGGFTGNIPILVLFTLLGASLALAIGLLIGTIFQTASTAGTISGVAMLIYILPAIIRPLAPLFGNSPLTGLVKVLPTYYFADGAYNALQGEGTTGSYLLDAGITLASIIIVFLFTLWVLRRQSAVAGAI